MIGSRRVKQLYDNIKALGITLADKHVDFLKNLKPFNIGFPVNFVNGDLNVTGIA